MLLNLNMSVRRQFDVVQLLIIIQALSTRVIHTLTVTTLSYDSPHLFTCPVINSLKRRCEEDEEENEVERPRPSQGGDRITEAYLRLSHFVSDNCERSVQKVIDHHHSRTQRIQALDRV
ncbi:hypothetical protein K503DRAFT_247318 [Rhizopogon vinicolor AM-OR11-026]|uniref:Uncharacterized protein n=1 Tax=Rhizopogon vinicolor AM-OR11-026 TaxID=1314800 RepID=A0A1B7MXB9_9AGAM|nr:hypothetical protein K503DRAFT_247318 [Rhizopogon vinicolor AM-OR11-026]